MSCQPSESIGFAAADHEQNTSELNIILPNSDREKKVLRYCLTMVGGLVLLDHATKLLAVHYLEGAGGIVVIPGFFNLVHVMNPGAAWGILAGQGWLLLVISLLVMVGMIVYIRKLTEGWIERYVALFLVVSGIIGNSIDRIWRGAVVDFLDFHIGSYHWPAFNVADSGITIGVGIFILSIFIRPQRLNEPENETAAV